MTKTARHWVVAGTLLAVAGITPALAQIEADSNEFEFLLGYYMADPEILDDSASIGFRAGRIVGNRLGLYGELSWFDGGARGEIPEQLLTIAVDYEVLFLDFVGEYQFNPESPVNFSGFAGFGWAFTSTTVSASVRGAGRPFSETLGGDSFNLQAGLSLRFRVTDKFHLRPAYRIRWLEAREGSDIDQEMLVGFGFKF